MINFFTVQYELFGMKKTITFQCASQLRSWESALEVLNDGFETKNFEVLSVRAY